WPKCSGKAPKSFAATLNAARVLVDGFSNNKAIFFPLRYGCGIPRFFFSLSSPVKSIKVTSSSKEKSHVFKKLFHLNDCSFFKFVVYSLMSSLQCFYKVNIHIKPK